MDSNVMIGTESIEEKDKYLNEKWKWNQKGTSRIMKNNLIIEKRCWILNFLQKAPSIIWDII